MNILADFHHSDLWWSHHLIFEKALGHTLFRPRGMEWLDRGYYGSISRETAAQFLVSSMFTLEQVVQYPTCRIRAPKDGDPGLRASMDTLNGSLFYPLIRTLTLEEFADADIDVIMPTLSQNQEPWLRLRNDLKPGAKLVREEGNVFGWDSIHPEYPNVMTSDLPTFLRTRVPNKVLYHQRFDLERVFVYREPTVFNRITCFMPGFRQSPELVAFLERHDLGGMEFVDYGHFSSRGFLPTKEEYVKALWDTSFVWHVKPGGDGFGHVIHNSIAVGRPVITVAEHYRGGIAWPMLLDGETCILIGDNAEENSKKIAAAADPGRIAAMSRRAAERFREVVDYDREADMIENFLRRLR